jgi:hypothetical protein
MSSLNRVATMRLASRLYGQIHSGVVDLDRPPKLISVEPLGPAGIGRMSLELSTGSAPDEVEAMVAATLRSHGIHTFSVLSFKRPWPLGSPASGAAQMSPRHLRSGHGHVFPHARSCTHSVRG